mmetsp:Transcript_108308/g.316841  ORF Transcript_108308/g.316841 Transcript_108308/m.316841 type:complete len:425 (-) Transcript_108308:68-1342(-)
MTLGRRQGGGSCRPVCRWYQAAATVFAWDVAASAPDVLKASGQVPLAACSADTGLCTTGRAETCEDVRLLRLLGSERADIREVLASWLAGCTAEELESCERKLQSASWLFRCARQGLLAEEQRWQRSSLLLLRHAAQLAASTAWKQPRAVEERVPCRKPGDGGVGRLFDEELLALPLVPGRSCQGGACSEEQCSLVVIDDVLSPGEAEELVSHGDAVAEKLAAAPQADDGPGKKRKVDIDLHLSAQHGQGEAHVSFLYALERLRRMIALAADVPVSWVHFASHFLSRVVPAGSSEAEEHKHTVHCDESSFPRFHHSAVLWLTPQDHDTGGEVEFYDADQQVWRRTVQPAQGRVVLFTSGWENIHRVTPLKRGRRWSLPSFASIRPPFNATRLAKACVRPSGSKQWQYCEDRLQQWLSAADEDLL